MFITHKIMIQEGKKQPKNSPEWVLNPLQKKPGQFYYLVESAESLW